MKVFEVEVDVTRAQWIGFDEDASDEKDVFTFDCQKKDARTYQKLNWFITNPTKKRGDFFYFAAGAFIFSEKVYQSSLLTCLEMAGQIIPITLESGENMYIMNVLECPNALDKERSKWSHYPDGTRRMIAEYVFKPNRFFESSLFKIPENIKARQFTYSGLKDPGDEFKPLYEKLGFTGLSFKEVWSQD